MRIFPHTREEWISFLLFPFEAYVVLAYLMAMVFRPGAARRCDDCLDFVGLHHFISCFGVGGHCLCYRWTAFRGMLQHYIRLFGLVAWLAVREIFGGLSL